MNPSEYTAVMSDLRGFTYVRQREQKTWWKALTDKR